MPRRVRPARVRHTVRRPHSFPCYKYMTMFITFSRVASISLFVAIQAAICCPWPHGEVVLRTLLLLRYSTHDPRIVSSLHALMISQRASPAEALVRLVCTVA